MKRPQLRNAPGRTVDASAVIDASLGRTREPQQDSAPSDPEGDIAFAVLVGSVSLLIVCLGAFAAGVLMHLTGIGVYLTEVPHP